MKLYHGSIVFSRTAEELASYTDSYLAVDNGTVEGIYPTLPDPFSGA